jgi:hypothetical protein
MPVRSHFGSSAQNLKGLKLLPICGYWCSHPETSGDVNTYERASSFESDEFFEGHQPAAPRAMGLSERVKSEPILR